MSAAVLLAFAAGATAAAGVVDVATTWRWKPGRGSDPIPNSRLTRIGRRVGAPAAPKDLSARLDAAGAHFSVQDAMAFKAGAAVAGALVGLLFAAAAPGRLGLALPLAGAAAGFLVLDVSLRMRATHRAHLVAIELPDVLDLLRVALEAGLPPTRALQEVGRRHCGVLATEFARAAARTAVGVTRHDALTRLIRRAPGEGVTAMVAILDRADRLGAPPSEALAALATDARQARARARAEAAAKAAPKIQLVVALLLVPSVMLLVAAALVPALLDTV